MPADHASTEAALAGHLDRVYELLADLSSRVGGPRLLRDCTGRDAWPRRGVYVFFEAGETRSDGRTPRIVRVGTHGLKAGSRSTLWGRLRQHRGNRDGGGDHRGSVIRRHIGTALIARGAELPGADTWGRGARADRSVRERERALEVAVSETVGAMRVLWIAVDDDPGPASLRGVIERELIALLSAAHRAGLERPSPQWLGKRAAAETVRSSGLWNVNHVAATYDPEAIDLIERHAAKTQ